MKKIIFAIAMLSSGFVFADGVDMRATANMYYNACLASKEPNSVFCQEIHLSPDDVAVIKANEAKRIAIASKQKIPSLGSQRDELKQAYENSCFLRERASNCQEFYNKMANEAEVRIQSYLSIDPILKNLIQMKNNLQAELDGSCLPAVDRIAKRCSSKLEQELGDVEQKIHARSKELPYELPAAPDLAINNNI